MGTQMSILPLLSFEVAKIDSNTFEVDFVASNEIWGLWPENISLKNSFVV